MLEFAVCLKKLQMPLPNEVWEKVIAFVDSQTDRNSVSLVSKDWYNAERWTRSKLLIRNCYAVSPEIVARRFLRIKSVRIKGDPRSYYSYGIVERPYDWGANVHSWLVVFAEVYPFLEELRLKRMGVGDKSLELIAKSFPGLRALSFLSCGGFSADGLKVIATHCRNLSELNIHKDDGWAANLGDWLSCFPENFASLEILNFTSIFSDVGFNALERLVSRCRSLRVLKVNEEITLDQLQRLLVLAPRLTDLGTGSFYMRELTPTQFVEIESAFSECKNLQALSGFWYVLPGNLPVVYGACAGLTFLDLSEVQLRSYELAKLLVHCPNLRRLWVCDTFEDKGLEAVGSSCPLLEELRVLALSNDFITGRRGFTELGLLDVSRGCPKLHHVVYFCKRMTNAAVVALAQNCPNLTHFRLFIVSPDRRDYLTNEPLDEAVAAVVRTCTKLRKLSVSGFITNTAFECIGNYATNLETLSVAFAGSCNRGMRCVVEGCPKLRKLEIRDCSFVDDGLLSGIEKHETLRSFYVSGCNLTMRGCKLLVREMPRLNVEVITDYDSDDEGSDIDGRRLNVEAIEDEGSDDPKVNKVYVYRSVAGPRQDARSSVLTT